MVFDIGLILTNTFSGILVQLPVFILVFWVVKTIVREMPGWLKILHNNNLKEIMVQKALNERKNYT